VYEKLLVPLDGSEVSELILPYAVELAKRCGSQVTLLQTVESLGQAMATLSPADPVLVTPGTTEAIVEGVEAEESSAKDYLAGIASRFKDEGIDAGTTVVSGSPGVEILRCIDDKSITVVAMSSHGRGGLGRAIFGSVADHVMHHATVPVLVLRYHKPED
jgi:nucleotide-binding universal stress UspA family protein